MPGDTLVVKINELHLNRDYAISDDGLVDRAVDPGLAAKAAALGKDVRWKLDRVNNVADSVQPRVPELQIAPHRGLQLPVQHLTTYTVPTRSMLGCA